MTANRGREVTGRKSLLVEGQRFDVACRIAEAMVELNGANPLFFRYGQLLVVVSPTSPRIETLDEGMLAAHFGNKVDFVNSKGNDAPPHEKVLKILFGSPKMFDLPELTARVEGPVLLNSGAITTTPGYYADGGVYYAGKPVDVPDKPNEANAREAVNCLLDLLCDFGFEDDASRANALAFLLTMVMRPAISGPTPLFVVTAAVAGTGKSLLVQILTSIWSGKPAASTVLGRNEVEAQKAIFSTLLDGTAVCVFDEVDGGLNSRTLTAVLTSHPEYRDRILGASKMVTVPATTIWAATGNNLTIGGDLPRRVVMIRLGATCERPSQRTGFKHRLPGAAIDERLEHYLPALLTMVAHWVERGRPDYIGIPKGSFDAWARAVGGVLHACGVSGFLENDGRYLDSNDEHATAWRRTVLAWHSEFVNASVGVADLYNLAVDPERLGNYINGDNERGRQSSFGKMLAKANGRVFAGLTIRKVGDRDHSSRYALVGSPERVEREGAKLDEAGETGLPGLPGLIPATVPADGGDHDRMEF